MKWIRYTKQKGKTTNFFEQNWNHATEAVVVKFKKDGYTYGLVLLNKDTYNTWHLYNLRPRRIPIVINRASSIYNLAMNTILYNHRVTRENAKNEIFLSMGDDDCLINWKYGYVYWKSGRSTMKRTEIEEWYITDKNKLTDWKNAIKEEEDETDDKD